MEAKMIFIGSLCLLLYFVLPADPQQISDPSITQDDDVPLDMAENSVDDMYSTCVTQMADKVKKKYFENELNESNGLFKKAWNNAVECAKASQPEDLTIDHMQAICAYTAGGPDNFYATFNEEVRTRGKNYSQSFPFHSLHFWLTTAVQILKKNSNTNTSLITYRRTKANFIGDVNQEIRFGSFASSSTSLPSTTFGKATCFEIETKHGANLKKYPKLKDREQEVLIPPYEKFKIISKNETGKFQDCKTVYVLESAGVQSNLDCTVAKQIDL